MNTPKKSQIGYAFALSRLVARLAGRTVRRAEFSRWEAYGLGILVFGISCLFVGRALLPLVRPGVLEWLTIPLLPFALWIAFLLWYFVNAQVAALFRRLGLYTARTNNPLQHFMIMCGTTLLALLFLRDDCAWIRSLGVFWLMLLLGNLLAIVILKFRHEP
ncbi:MAG TPA: hypothetical protein VGL24_03475 [Chthoniobacterales bacterium]|jgi:hypothetical protein